MDDLDRDFIRAMCPKPCEYITTTEVLRHPDGREELVRGEPPLPLCRACPTLEEARSPIRHIEIMRSHRPGAVPGEATEDARAQMFRGPTPEEIAADPDPPAPEPEAVADDNPDDLPIPPSWGPHHPSHPSYRKPKPTEGGPPVRSTRPRYDEERRFGLNRAGDPDRWDF